MMRQRSAETLVPEELYELIAHIRDCGGRLGNHRIYPEADAVARVAQAGRVCQAWYRTGEVQVLAPGIRGAEGEAKGEGIHREVGSGGSPIQRRGATHRNRR